MSDGIITDARVGVLELNLALEGGPLRYLQRGRIVEIPAGRMALFWGGIPHRLLSPDTAVDGVWLTLPLPRALQWELPGDPVHRLLAGEVWVESESADDPELTRRWVDDFASGDPHRLRVMRLEIDAVVQGLHGNDGVGISVAPADCPPPSPHRLLHHPQFPIGKVKYANGKRDR